MKRAAIASMGATFWLAAVPAQAAGDRTQGTYLCGEKLEILSGGEPTGNCLAVKTGNPSGGSMTLDDGTVVTVSGCADKGKYWECPQASFSQPSVCSAPTGTSIPVYVLKAKTSFGRFDFSTPGLTIVCGDQLGRGPQLPTCGPRPQEISGKAGDCILWGFEPTADERLFNACVRMARADYLGNGWSATKAGTRIQPGTASSRCDCTDCDSCFEAYWTDLGAVCIHHKRWAYVTSNLTSYLYNLYKGGKVPEHNERLPRECFRQYTLRCAKRDAELRLSDRFPAKVPWEKALAQHPVKEGSKHRAPPKDINEWLACQDGTTPGNALLWNRSRRHICLGPNMQINPCQSGAYDPDCSLCSHP